MPSEPVTINNSRIHRIDSKYTGRTYRITISLPLGYVKPSDKDSPFYDAPDIWPVVYVLDGNWYTGLVTDTVRVMSWCRATTDAIIVGIGYEEYSDPIETLQNAFVRRNLDLTPIQNDEAEAYEEIRRKRPAPTGDAGNFLNFISEELIPHIETTYRANPDQRILLGHSSGGLFALFALFESPECFDTIIAGSIWFAFGDRYAFQMEEAFAKDHDKLPVKVCLFAGELEEDIMETTLTDTSDLLRLWQTANMRSYH